MSKNKNNSLLYKILNFSLFSFEFSYEISEIRENYRQVLQILLSNNYPNTSEQDLENLSFTTKEVLNIPYTCKLQTSSFDNIIKLNFSFKAQNFINVCLMVIIFAAFFSTFSLVIYFWFSIIFLLIFYILNRTLTFTLSKGVVNAILLHTELDDKITAEQQAWIADPNKCSACGTMLHKYNYNCPECGLFIKSSQLHKPHTSTENIGTIKYIYKDNEEN